jgi:hypothetical protein
MWRVRDEMVRSRYGTALATGTKEVDDVNDLKGIWDGMEKACLETTAEICGWTSGLQRHKETWCWNEDVRETLNTKLDCFTAWHETLSAYDRATDVKAKYNAKKVVALAQESKRQDQESMEGKKNAFRFAKQVAKERHDVVRVNCLKSDSGNIVKKKNLELYSKLQMCFLNPQNVLFGKIINTQAKLYDGKWENVKGMMRGGKE